MTSSALNTVRPVLWCSNVDWMMLDLRLNGKAEYDTVIRMHAQHGRFFVVQQMLKAGLGND